MNSERNGYNTPPSGGFLGERTMTTYVFEDPNVGDSFEVEASSLDEATAKFLDGYDTLDGGEWDQISVRDARGYYVASLTIYPDGKGGIESRNLVTVSQRKNIIQPADWWAAFESEAASKGVSLSEWIGAACRKSLPKDARVKLSERVGRGRPSNPDAN